MHYFCAKYMQAIVKVAGDFAAGLQSFCATLKYDVPEFTDTILRRNKLSFAMNGVYVRRDRRS